MDIKTHILVNGFSVNWMNQSTVWLTGYVQEKKWFVKLNLLSEPDNFCWLLIFFISGVSFQTTFWIKITNISVSFCNCWVVLSCISSCISSISSDWKLFQSLNLLVSIGFALMIIYLRVVMIREWSESTSSPSSRLLSCSALELFTYIKI